MDTQGTPSKEFLETLVDRNLDENFRPKTPCECPKVTKMSDREVIMDVKQKKNRQSNRNPGQTSNMESYPFRLEQ